MQAHGKEAVDGQLCYDRHRPEQTLLYQLIEQHYPALVAHLAEQGKMLPDYVRQEFDAYLKCGRLEHVRVKGEKSTASLGRPSTGLPVIGCVAHQECSKSAELGNPPIRQVFWSGAQGIERVGFGQGAALSFLYF